ncbi:F0F1 ATP synthase subunit delta [Gorillibacterium sp. sgz5001074]|uniref:F0F1 ATP synthase subunit delta n=1 Tax=Gorillibacterium sp. sgz5001074 TaxID=3446695 RepID=UPI003F679B9A
MSRDLTAAKRYARALYEASKEKNSVNTVVEDWKTVLSLIQEQPDLETLLNSPNIDTSAKTGLLKQIFAGSLSDLALNTLVLLVERKRSELIPAVYEQFVKIANEASGRADATVYSAMALSEEEATAIAARFTNLTGKAIHVTNIVDSSLLGGIKVRIGDKLYDGSLSGKLERMEKVLEVTQAL